MKLEALPDTIVENKFKKREQDVTPRVREWFIKCYPFSAAWEVKATKKDHILTNTLRPHQAKALRTAKTDTLAHKMHDIPGIQMPCDGFSIVQGKGVVVACFTAHNTCKAIDVDDWCALEEVCYDDDIGLSFNIKKT